MARGPRTDDTTRASGTATGASPGARYLLVLGDDLMITHALPLAGEVVLGRAPDSDVPLAHDKISRRHVRLHVGDEVVVEDLGSTNGVKIGGRKLAAHERAPLAIGDSLRLGPFTAILLRRPADASITDDGRARAAVTVRDPTVDGAGELVERVAKHGVNVLISGETGTGKEVLARTLHALSGRPGELVAINCAALSGPLLESELFGHEQGAFTGASRAKPGLLEVAGKGTALLDEVGDLPLELQGKLLRALEARQVYRVGGVKPVALGVRVIAATHRRLPDEVAAGRFRQDLYFRLNGITLEIPPLRERREQIAELARGFLADAARAAGVATPTFTVRAMTALTAHDWPGNVRELRLVVERALLLAGGRDVDAKHVLLSPARTAAPAERGPVDERARFVEIARAQRGNVSAIGRELGTSRSQVRRLAARFAIDLDALKSAR